MLSFAGCGLFMSIIRYHPYLLKTDRIPPPRLPMLPPISLRDWRGSRYLESAFLDPRSLSFTQGRYALLEALAALGVDSESAVLMPSYHCRSLVEPADLLGAHVLFYPVAEALTPRLDLAGLLFESSPLPVKAMIMPYYFGFPQPVAAIETFCQERSIFLIEDCAHAFFGSIDGRQVGRIGRFAFASPRKFFPIEDGGILLDNASSAISKPVPLSLKKEIKAIIRAALQLTQRRRQIKPEQTSKLFFYNNLSQPESQKLTSQAAGYETGLKWLVPHQRRLASAKVSRWIMHGTARQPVIDRRRQAYLRWLAGLKDIAGCRPLFPHLDDNIVPYVFPLLIDMNPDRVFYALKMQGVPLWRWEDMAVTDCPVSLSYRHRLLQLPCHQNLNMSELDWMIKTVTDVLNAESRECAQ